MMLPIGYNFDDSMMIYIIGPNFNIFFFIRNMVFLPQIVINEIYGISTIVWDESGIVLMMYFKLNFFVLINVIVNENS